MAIDFNPELAEADLYLAVDALFAVSQLAKRALNLELGQDDALVEINDLALAIVDALNRS